LLLGFKLPFWTQDGVAFSSVRVPRPSRGSSFTSLR
jgi:hypothetical protein